jgi:hypothetical protein
VAAERREGGGDEGREGLDLQQLASQRGFEVVKSHVEEIILTPNDDRSGYVVEGQWDLLGKERFRSVLKECGVRLVPGGGVEPPRGVNLGGF